MTRETWTETFQLMVTFMRERKFPINKGELEQLYQYYRANSPVAYSPLPDDFEGDTLGFRQLSAGLPPKSERPQVTHVNVQDLYGDGKPGVVVCDDDRSSVSYLQFRGGEWKEDVLAEVPAPVKSAVFDFEGDGDMDMAIASLGYLHPSDDLIGEAHLLINRGDNTFEDWIIAQNVARISDMQPADIDGDGDLDFIVAKFGWVYTGGLMWLEQVSPKVYREHSILEINGPMRLEVLDYDADGDDDFICMITQEHESIVLFRNEGGGKFSNRLLIRATHPAYGSSSFQMVDLDQDGDVDILATNGDMMDDSPEWKPYHGVRWFENVNGNFQIRPLVHMPGCYCARAYDMDGDGDLDVVSSNMNFFWEDYDYPCLVWLENDGQQNFTKRRISYDPQNLVTSDVGDLNHDGIPDIIGGGMHVPGPMQRVGRLTLWLGGGSPNAAAGNGVDPSE